MGGGVSSPKVHNGPAVGSDGAIVVIDGGHPIAVKTGRDGGLIDQGDLGGPEFLERIHVFVNAWADGLTGNPLLVLFGVHATAFDDVQADVDDVDVVHWIAGAAGEGRAGEKAEDKVVESVGWMPIHSHVLAIGFAVHRRCLSVVVDEPQEHVDEDEVGLAEALLLE